MTPKTQKRWEEKVSRIERLMRLGQTLAQACKTVGVANSTSYYKWKRELSALTEGNSSIGTGENGEGGRLST